MENTLLETRYICVRQKCSPPWSCYQSITFQVSYADIFAASMIDYMDLVAPSVVPGIPKSLVDLKVEIMSNPGVKTYVEKRPVTTK